MVNITETSERRVFFTSDPHLGHNPKWDVPLWQARGYANVKEHDDMWMDITNELVREDDILFMLGDFCLNTTIDQFNAYLDRIRCRNLWCLFGNHNNPHEKAIYRKAMGTEHIGPFAVEKYPFQYKNMLYIGHRIEAVINGQFMVMDHYPLYVWNEMAHGAWMLCGHSHNGCPLSRGDNHQGKILDVGWDGHGKPWSMSELQEVMNKKQILVVDHHRPDGPKEPLTV